MSRLALGTVQFGLNYGVANRTGQVSMAAAQEMLTLARSSQINMVDTAIAYGDSEKILGELGVVDMSVITKLPAMPSGCADVAKWMETEFTQSLSRLGLSAVYGLLLHRADLLTNQSGVDREVWAGLQKLKNQGLVKKIGVSVYSPRELDNIAADYAIDIVQAPLNLIDQELIASGWLDRLKEAGVEVHTRSAFLQGLLLMDRLEIPEKFSKWDAVWDRWQAWQKSEGISALEACLAFPQSIKGVDRVVVGADSAAQLAQIIQAANVQIPKAFPEIRQTSEQLINPSLWGRL